MNVLKRFSLLPWMSIILCLGCLAAASAATLPARRDIPDAKAQAAMEKLVRELYAKEYADHAPAARRKLAAKLLDQADRTQNDPTAQYVLWKEAADLACQGGDSLAALRALTLMDRDFQINGLQLKEAALRQVLRSIRLPQQARDTAEQAMLLADDAELNQDEPSAERLDGLAQAAANKSRQVKLALEVRDRKKEFADLRRQRSECEASEAKLKSNQADAADRLRIGKMRCFMLGDWKTGLPLLADGSDAALQTSARCELAAQPDDALACMAVANTWWDQAQHQNRLEQRQVLRHAAQWYRRARPGVSGVNLDIAEQRLTQIPLTTMEIARLSPGLTTDIFSGQQFDHFLVRRIDPQINFNWGNDALGPTLPKDDFSLRWRGYVLAPREGLYTFVLLANSGGRLAIDGKKLIDSDKLSHSRKGVRVQLHLSSGAHALRAACWDGGGTAKAILQWIVPGESEPVAVPPQALRRE
jgi:hypothetical protein